MPSNVATSAGTLIYIGDAAPATYNKVGFEAVVWTLIGEVVNIPQFGRVYDLSTHIALGNRRTIKRKAAFNDGSATLEYARDETDVGQIALEGFIDSDDDLPIRIILPTGLITHIYFTMQLMSNPITIGTVGDITSKSAQVEITNDILFEVAP